MGLLSLLFPSLRRPKPSPPQPRKSPGFKRGARVYILTANCQGSVVDVRASFGQWVYTVDLDSHEPCQYEYFEAELSLHETHPHWNLPNG